MKPQQQDKPATASNRHQRRADVARFRSEVAGGLLSYLVEASDPRLASQPLLARAVQLLAQKYPDAKAECFGGCGTAFSHEVRRLAAFLLVSAKRAVIGRRGGLCMKCWRDLSPEALSALPCMHCAR